MCGIAGGIKSGLNKEHAAAVIQKLAHRGPDDSGIFMEGEVWLGNTRLAIRDLSERGHQPMHTADRRYTLVFNGEIYNHLSLRQKLADQGVQFSSSCDTETLLQAYALWGKDCLHMLQGDFAFAVYDSFKQEVFIARDPMGVKPLYFYWHEQKMLFGSELKALMGLPEIDYSLKTEAFYNYLYFQYSPTEDTPFRHFKKLMPGQYLCHNLSDTYTVTRRHHSIPLNGEYKQQGVKEWVNELDELLCKSVATQLRSDTPIGLTLSGGIDSSLIAALARKTLPDDELHAFCINTHGDMKEEGFEDDFSFARLVAKKHHINLHEVSGKLNIGDELDRLIWHLDEPQADPAAVHMLHISAAAQEMGIKVLLSGTGGDDVFSGYRRHQAIPYLQMKPYVGEIIRSLTGVLLRIFPGSTILRRAAKVSSGAGLSLNDAMINMYFWMEPERVNKLFHQDWLTKTRTIQAYNIFRDLLHEIPDEQSPLNKMLFWEQRTFLPHHNLAYMDKLGMANSVEVRVPFVDKAIVELAASMPPGIKLQGRTTKWILREVAKSYLPTPVINRKKTGFGAPLRAWMKADGQTLLKQRLLDESFLNRGIFNQQAIGQLISDNHRGRVDGAYTLFSLLSIESWLRQFAPSS